MEYKEDKKIKILKVAETVFAEKGFHATKVEDIANLAGVAKGTVYLYFKSKEQLFFSTIKFMIQGMIETIKERMAGIEDPLDRLKIGIKSYFEYVTHHKQIFFIILNEEIASSRKSCEKDNQKKHVEIYRQSQKFVTDLMKSCIDAGYLKPIDPVLLSSALSGLLQKMVVNSIVFNIDINPDQFYSIAVDLFLNGAMLRKEAEK